MSWTWPVGLLDPYAVQQASYNLVAAAAVGRFAADVAHMAAADAKEAAQARQRDAEAAEAARLARARMAQLGAEALADMRASTDALQWSQRTPIAAVPAQRSSRRGTSMWPPARVRQTRLEALGRALARGRRHVESAHAT
jgi:hypothetical protein